jgi:hypothetical protein
LVAYPAQTIRIRSNIKAIDCKLPML